MIPLQSRSEVGVFLLTQTAPESLLEQQLISSLKHFCFGVTAETCGYLQVVLKYFKKGNEGTF